MRVLICHNKYKLRGGEEVVFEAEMDLLLRAGHQVEAYTVCNDQIDSLSAHWRAGINVTYSYSSRDKLANVIRKFRPDIAHFHNTFPLLTPSVYDACIEAGVPSVQTLHNYRPICPGSLLLRDREVCDKCVTGSPYWGTIHRCYRGSYLQSFAATRMVSHHRRRNTWNEKVSKFIALTDSAKKRFVTAGFLEKKIAVKPNFLDDVEFEPVKRGSYILFVGRLSKEKGVETLVEALKECHVPLKIVGGGPLTEFVKKEASPNIQLLGELPRNEVFDLMRRARFLIMPSECIETFGIVIIEAFAHGLPVLCSSLVPLASDIDDGRYGLTFETGNVADLRAKALMLYEATDKCQEMGGNARRLYEHRYTAEANYQTLMGIYEGLLEEQRDHPQRLTC